MRRYFAAAGGVLAIGFAILFASGGGVQSEGGLTRTARYGGRAWPRAATVVVSDPSSETDLNGYAVPLAKQCTGVGLFTELPRQALVFTRASSAYCAKSDGTYTLVSTDVPRRERAGLLAEPSSTNDLLDPNDLTTGNWTRSSITAAKTATGPTGAANSATTLTATGSNGTITQTFTVSSTKRSSSFIIKRRTGSGAITVTRNNFGAGTDISSSLSSSIYLRVWANCGGGSPTGGDDLSFSRVDNCIAASNLTSTAANPTIGIKIATSGDAIDVWQVQDEANDYPTSPMIGFSRAIDRPSVASTASLPTTQGELSLDWVSMRSSGVDPDNFLVLLKTSATAGSANGVSIWVNEATGGVGAYLRAAGSVSQLGPSTSSIVAGQARNNRLVWGATGNSYYWEDGLVLAAITDGSSNNPSSHVGPYVIGDYLADDTAAMGGWITRVRWTAGASSTFKGSNLNVIFIGDSIVEASLAAEGSKPSQTFSSMLAGHAVGGAGARPAEKFVHDLGTSGLTASQCKTNWDAQVTASVLYGTESRTVMMWQCGTNSSGDGAAAVWAIAEAALDSAKAAGIKVIPATITPYLTNASFISTYNASLLAWCTTNSVTCANTFAALEDPTTPGQLNPTYNFGDGLHLNSAGAVAEATVWFNAGRASGHY